MGTSAREPPSAAAATFRTICERSGVLSGAGPVSTAWEVFKELCEIPLERTLEGAQFGFKQAKFELPHGPFYLSFTRYWYEHGEVSDTPHLAQFAIKYAFEPELVPLSFELETSSNASDVDVDLANLRAFIAKIENKTDLWNALSVRRPISVDFYAGPQ
jgi:hypothetical protein